VLDFCSQGGYMDISSFIAGQGFKTGKGGYQKARLSVVQRCYTLGLGLNALWLSHRTTLRCT